MKKTFTLIELMVVIAIIGILGVVITPVIRNAIEKAKVAKVVSLIGTLETACEMFYNDTLQYAEEVTTSHDLFQDNPTTPIAGWFGPYIKKPLSSIDNPYHDPSV